ncbi:hypothetical protein I3I95_11155 [bacterium]|nr:hypothetical protein [bacterium]
MEAITRRTALRRVAVASLAAAGALTGALARGTRQAWADPQDTAAALADAQAQYQQVQAQIDDLSAQYESMSVQLADTKSAMEAKQGEINDTQAQIDETEAELVTAQDQLASVMESDYRNGSTHALDVILNSSDFEDLYRNIYYLTKVSDSEAELIEHTKSVKQQLDDQQATLQSQLADLDSLRSDQESQLADMQASQESLYGLLSGLSDQVSALTEQYNQELLEQARAEEEARQAAAAAQAAAASAATAVSYASSDGGAYATSSAGGGSAAAVVSACYSTPSPGAGYCAMWVSQVFSNAGMGYYGGNACDMYASWCYSSDRSALMPGMIVAVSTHSLTSAGRIYGHIGIYVGGGMMMDNIGYIRTIDVDSWIGTYSTTVPALWGWLGGVALS